MSIQLTTISVKFAESTKFAILVTNLGSQMLYHKDHTITLGKAHSVAWKAVRSVKYSHDSAYGDTTHSLLAKKKPHAQSGNCVLLFFFSSGCFFALRRGAQLITPVVHQLVKFNSGVAAPQLNVEVTSGQVKDPHEVKINPEHSSTVPRCSFGT